MKNRFTLLFITALAAGSLLTAAETKESPVTVKFNESEKFTDAASHLGGGTDQHYLDTLAEHLQRVAAHRLAPGQKLEVTFTDIDLAGDFLPSRAAGADIRVVKDIYIPRQTLFFRLLDADGKVVKEGERRLTDLNFMSNTNLIDRNLPLYYDKALISDWVRREFR
jgi:hypothetical protein